MKVNPIELALFANRLDAVCDEMGAVLRQAAFSPNIRDRLDYSCAIFDRDGQLSAQAAHIPVHLGSMAHAMAAIVAAVDWADGDMLVLNDPFLGGTHLPDVTLIAPLFAAGDLIAFVANRAHHADIGAASPGSMPVSSRLDEEGLVIAPVRLVRHGEIDSEVIGRILGATRNPEDAQGDFYAQVSANRAGLARLGALIAEMGAVGYAEMLDALNAYGERLARNALSAIPTGLYRFEDRMDDDGQGTVDIPIRLAMRVDMGEVSLDFGGTAPQVAGNINCPLAVAAAAVLYVFRCLMPHQTPACAGSFRPIRLAVPEGCFLNARRPAAVAAGNVETSSRIVDVVMGALAQAIPEAIPAASHGSMNNLAMGSAEPGSAWDYYETMGGGMGAGPLGGGWSGVQSHMTNTLNTPVEVVESRFPIRIQHYGLRSGSGGRGRRNGGEGLVRSFRFLAPAQVTLLTERRRFAPWGIAGGLAGAAGHNRLNGQDLAPKVGLAVETGDLLCVETPGGGGWGGDFPEPMT
ncbi:hydantoinase B/oxoprolinase family protein [Imhoffiella purpurea]|uniref:N-methylhydantoinase (ATP-hydrolyzing) n=1 Tax=Imhoffiella purpurea TaxID=1249627 RepID=W9VDD8_9GAMM|nr:hydantoinase B/oxoprolinase family protein [Imhoffiella purpurea]EXJ15001.1 N-methylhydantoinase (ATP-hydrolyzing) [Imhoffiella purpurea]